MDTKILACGESALKTAAQLIKQGEVVGMPTETVYGLAADAFNEEAVKKIFKAKGRPADNPLIVHIYDVCQIQDIAASIPPAAYKCAEKFWGGPLTMIMPKSDKIPDITSGGLDTVGIRMPSNPIARRFIQLCGTPVAAPSANLSGSPSPTTAMHVFKDMNGKIPAIIDGGSCNVGVESTVISFEGENGIRLLRPGFISVEDLKEVTTNVTVDKGVVEKLDENTLVRSPGMKYKHYAPKAEITIVDGNAQQFARFVSEQSGDFMCMVFDKSDIAGLDVKFVEYGSTSEIQAQKLFDTLRRLDEIGAKKVFARCPDKNGVGLAVYNRLLRAAAFRVVKCHE